MGSDRTATSGAPWFAITTDILGILALGIAALANVLLLRMIRRQRKRATPG